MKAFTDIEQSKKLAEILPIESADMHYVRKTHDFMGNPVDGEWSHPKYGNPNTKHANYIVQNFETLEKMPCWSLAALLNYLREIDFFPEIDADEHGVTMSIDYYNEDEGKLLNPVHNIKVKAESFVDACYEMIIKFKKENLL
jgi:hypothetical protein